MMEAGKPGVSGILVPLHVEVGPSIDTDYVITHWYTVMVPSVLIVQEETAPIMYRRAQILGLVIL